MRRTLGLALALAVLVVASATPGARADGSTSSAPGAADMVGRYARYKRQVAKLDYDDLIIRTAALLSGPGPDAAAPTRAHTGLRLLLLCAG